MTARGLPVKTLERAIGRVICEVRVREHGPECPALSLYGAAKCNCGYDAVRTLPSVLAPRTAERSYTRTEVLAFGERVRDMLTERGWNALPPTWNVVAMRSQELDLAALLDAPERGGGR